MQIHGNYGFQTMPYRVSVDSMQTQTMQSCGLQPQQVSDNQSVLQQMMGLVTMLVQTLVGLVQGLVGRGVQKSEEGGSSTLKNILGMVRDIIGGLFGGSKEAESSQKSDNGGFCLGDVLDIGKSILGGVGSIFKGGWGAIKDIGSSILKGIKSLF
jgi:phage-related protein